MTCRTEADAYGGVSLPAHVYWGPRTERARLLLSIGSERLPLDVNRCFGAQKAAAARANHALGLFHAAPTAPIATAADEMREGRFDDQFPIALWQTGSGTQTNMNANEVIANRANEILGRPLGSRHPVHPSDHVNLGRSLNDTFPTVMHLCVIRAVSGDLASQSVALSAGLHRKADAFDDHVKIGVTHLQDSLPITLGMCSGPGRGSSTRRGPRSSGRPRRSPACRRAGPPAAAG